MRTHFVLFAAAIILTLTVSGIAAQQAPAASLAISEWKTATPEEQGIDSARLAEALLAMQSATDIHSLTMIRNGSVVVDAYFYPYDGTTVHEVASVTKSIVPMLIGIAVDQGKLDIDDPIVSFFPDITIANRNSWKESITVRHLLTMSSGLDCTSERDEATLREMKTSENWVQFALDREVKWEPGSHFVYCSPAMHLLSPILEQATGLTALDFASQYLFTPLGIHDVLWTTDPQGYNVGSEGLYLHPHDVAKLGELYLNYGVWDGAQIVSRQWVEASVAPQMELGGNDTYGYGWWVSVAEPFSYNADGRGGQHIAVIPVWNMLLVTTGGGFAWDEIVPLLVGTIVDMSEPIAANPDGVAELEAAVATVAQAPAPAAMTALPDTAVAISGQTFVFEPNPLGIDSVCLRFDGSAGASLDLKAGDYEIVSAHVALDGVYQLFPGNYGLPMGFRGRWMDDETFVLEYDTIANNDHATWRMRFEGAGVEIESRETAHEIGAAAQGTMQTR